MSSERMTWYGHATCEFEIGGARFITDPILRHRFAHLVRWERLDLRAIAGTDVVLLSHAHQDHLDVPSLRWLARQLPEGRRLRIIAPPGAADVVRRARIKHLGQVDEVRPGDTVTIGDASIRVTPAEHEGTRWPRAQGPHALAVGYVIDGASRWYFPGDTSEFDEMADIGPVDIALLPIGGWWRTLGPGHLDPESTWRAARLLQARTVIPIHWGSFRPLGAAHILRHERLQPALQLQALADADASSGITVVQCAMGETFST